MNILSTTVLVLSSIFVGILAATEYSHWLIGLIFIILIWSYIFKRWQRGLTCLIVYLPFAGAVTLALMPWHGGVLLKDILIIVPIYVGFMIAWRHNAINNNGFPVHLIVWVLALSLLVIVNTMNKEVSNILMALIGVKVWLFYLPLMFISYCAFDTRESLFRILRLMVLVSLLPCVFGIAEALAVQVLGYEYVMSLIYGNLAASVTQNFANVGASVNVMFPRIPSSFSYWVQYYSFTLAMIVPAFAIWRGDLDHKWRNIGGIGLVVITFASLLSGARAAFLFVPLIFIIIAILSVGQRSGVILRIVTLLFAGLLGAIAITGAAGRNFYKYILDLTEMYGKGLASESIYRSIVNSPLGNGTGTNTGPARYALDDPSDVSKMIENYYAKAVLELGIPGLLVVLGIFIVLIKYSKRVHNSIADPSLKAVSSAILAFLIIMFLNSFKGWTIDLDPVNVYYWVFSGMILRLKYLERIN